MILHIYRFAWFEIDDGTVVTSIYVQIVYYILFSELKIRLEEDEAEKLFTDSRAKMLKSKMMDIHVENHLLKMVTF